MTLQLFRKDEEVEKLQFFQNIVPGKQESPFIERYKEECLSEDNEENNERRQLLNHFPPVLSFYEQQKKKFYEKEAQNCQQYCCGGMSMNMSGDKPILEPKDHYMFSTGSGKMHEGNASSITKAVEDDIRKEPFGSPQQNKEIAALQQFANIVDQRQQGFSPAKPDQSADLTQDQGYSPFQTNLKPKKE